MKVKTNFKDVLKIVAIEVVIYLLMMVFFQIEAAWILLVLLAAIGGAIAFAKLAKEKADRLRALFTNNRGTVLITLVVLLALYPVISPLIIRQSAYWMLVLIQTMIYMLLALGLNIQLGSTGMMNLASAAFYGIGAYTAGLLSLRFGLPAIVTLPAAGVVTALFGLVLFVPIFKTKGHYLALVTLAFGIMIVLALDNTEWTGGSQGLMNIPEMKFFGYSFLHKVGKLHFYTNYFYFTLALTVLGIFVASRLFNSWVGVTLATIRDDEIAAKCCGVNASYWKLIAFMTGNFMMGVAGAVYAHMIGFISPPNFQFVESLVIVSIVILGGMDNILGVLVGALILVIMPEKMRVITEYRVLIYGILIVVMLIFRPGGLLPQKPRKYHASVVES
jgi:ABC-type branched-subunit amino acid transport system permease subunit